MEKKTLTNQKEEVDIHAKRELLIRNMVNFYILFEQEFSNLVPEIEGEELTPLLSRMLNEIHFQGRTTAKEIGNRLNLSDSNTSRGVNILHRIGYIDKNTCTIDKRISYITLSPLGLKLMQDALKKNQELYFEKLSVLSEEDLDALVGHFEDIKNIFIKINKQNKR